MLIDFVVLLDDEDFVVDPVLGDECDDILLLDTLGVYWLLSCERFALVSLFSLCVGTKKMVRMWYDFGFLSYLYSYFEGNHNHYYRLCG